MPAPLHNQYAAKPESERASAQITLRVPSALKGRAVKAARRRDMKLSPWLEEAIAEKCNREAKKP